MIKSLAIAAITLAIANPGVGPMNDGSHLSYDDLWMGEIVQRVNTRELYLVVRDERSFEIELVQILQDGSLWSYESDVDFLRNSTYDYVSNFNFHR